MSEGDGGSGSEDGSGPRGDVAGAGDSERDRSRIELFGVLLIALTAVVTSWSAFEASKWGAEMSINFNAAGSARTESVRASNDANNEFGLDVSLFGEYANAINREDVAFGEFVAARFPERLATAVDAWMATDPLTSPDAPATPFDMDEYVLESQLESERLAERADDRTAAALESGETSDDYMITSVMFALVILFAALSSKLEHERHQRILLRAASVLFVISAAVIGSFPKIF